MSCQRHIASVQATAVQHTADEQLCRCAVVRHVLVLVHKHVVRNHEAAICCMLQLAGSHLCIRRSHLPLTGCDYGHEALLQTKTYQDTPKRALHTHVIPCMPHQPLLLSDAHVCPRTTGEEH